MKRVGIVALLAGLAFVLYLWTQPAYTHRFRLTIEVETPDGIKTGSSVIETSAWESGNWGPIEARGIRRDFRGRAVFVDLGHGQNLIALLGFGPIGADQHKLFSITRAALASSKKTDDWKEEFRLNGRGVLPNDYIPAFATFKNLNDPASAVRVEPSDLANILGAGFAFRQALLETTNESVSRDIGNILPWWQSPGHPAEVAYRAWRKGSIVGPTLSPEELFQKE
jgi:hypothetical protein